MRRRIDASHAIARENVRAIHVGGSLGIEKTSTVFDSAFAGIAFVSHGVALCGAGYDSSADE
jgi:hypothetical protein